MPIDRISHLHAPVRGAENGQNRAFHRRFAHFLCSNLGLVILVVSYSVGGAFLFILLEQYVELQSCQQASLSENISVTNISETMANYIAISTDNTTVIYQYMVDLLENFTNDIYERRNDYRYTGQDCPTTSGWSFPSALLFTITIITSIGYGHITPVTWEGQITCICYALIGIPLFLLCLAEISSILGDVFRLIYSFLLHCCCCVCRGYSRERGRKIRKLQGKKANGQDGNNYVGTTSIDPSWPEAHLSYDDKLSNDDDEFDDDGIDEDNIDDVWTRMESRVPTGVVISFIIGYICLGAYIFVSFEGWTMIESIYFCYITLSTVGFGDFVPGVTSSSTSGLRFLATSLYILFGLAILAMCFDLLKESMVNKFQWIAHKLGITPEYDDRIDDDPTGYANFEYTQQQRMNSGKRSDEKMKTNDSYDAPPAYDSVSTNGQWLKNIKDKTEPSTNFRAKQTIPKY